MKDTDLAWFAGIIDGEGSIGIGRSSPSKYNGVIYVAQVQLVNCEKKLMDHAEKILNDMGLSKRICTSHRERNGYIGVEYYLNIQRQADVKLVLETIYPYLISKKPQAEIVLEFVNERIAAKHRVVAHGGKYQKTYTGNEDRYVERLKPLNKHRPRKHDETKTGEKESGTISS